jgi:hypothetical protein
VKGVRNKVCKAEEGQGISTNEGRRQDGRQSMREGGKWGDLQELGRRRVSDGRR